MGLKEIYYHIEDRWFALLDWLEAHHVNLYPVVDPLEKKGVPSLPVFTALFLIFIYVLFSFILPGIGGGGGGGGGDGGGFLTVNVLDNNTSFPLAGFAVELYQQGSLQMLESSVTGTNGAATFSPKSGTLEARASKQSCQAVTRVINADVEKNVTLRSSCQNLTMFSPKAFCFVTSPPDKDPGTISYKAFRSGTLQDEDVCSDASGKCTFTPQSGYSYRFEGMNGFESTTPLEAGVLAALADQGENGCITLKEKPKPPEDNGKVTVIVSQAGGGKLVPGVRVELVNPQDENSLIDPEASKLTGTTGSYQGKAAFDGLRIGTEFSVIVRAGTNTSFHKDNRTFNVSALGLTINITINISTPTQVSVRRLVGGIEEPLAGVAITFFNKLNEKVGSRLTSNTGDLVIGLTRSEPYRAAFFLAGYEYKEEKVVGGENKTVFLEAIPAEDLANLDTYLLFKTSDHPVTDATLNIKRKDNSSGQWIPSGYPSQLVDEDGHALWNSLMAEEVCIQPSRPKGKMISCTAKSLEAGDNELIIKIEPNRFPLRVWVFKETLRAGANNTRIISLDGVKDSTVTLFNWENEAKLDSGKTFPDGHYRFEVGEDKTVRVDVDYEDAFGRYPMTAGPLVMDGQKTVNFTLALLSNNVTFRGVRDADGNQLSADGNQLSGETLQTGRAYSALFDIGLKDIRNNRWDNVTLALENADGFLWFYPPTLSPFTFSALPDSKLTATLTGQYDHKLRDTTYTLSIPFTAKPVFSGTHNTALRFHGEWRKGNDAPLRDPETGEKIAVVQLQSGICEKINEWGVCMSVNSQRPAGISVAVGDEPIIEFRITNLGESLGESGFNGRVTLTDRDSNIVFNRSESETFAYKALLSGALEEVTRGSSFVVTDHNIVLSLQGNLPSGNPVSLRQGETLILTARAKTISPTEAAQIALEVGGSSEPLGYFNFRITGTTEAEIRLEPARLFDLTPSISIRLFEKANKKQIKTLVSSGTLSGEGLTCPNGIDFQSIVDGSDPRTTFEGNDAFSDVDSYSVAFDNSCRLTAGGDATVSITHEITKPATLSKRVEACVSSPGVLSLPRLSVNGQEECKVTFRFTTDADEQGYANMECGPSQAVNFGLLKDMGCSNLLENSLKIKSTALECEDAANCGVGGLLFNISKQSALSNQPAYVKFNYKRNTSVAVRGSIIVNFELYATAGYGSEPLASTHSVMIPFEIGPQPPTGSGGGGGGGGGVVGDEFAPLDIPKEFANFDDAEWCSEDKSPTRFCTIEQALHYGYALSNFYNSITDVDVEPIIEKNVRLLMPAGLTASDVREIAAAKYASPRVAPTVMTLEQFLASSPAPGNWLVIDGTNSPQFGRNGMTIRSGNVGTGRDEVRYSVVSFRPLPNNEIEELLTTSFGVQLYMPAITYSLKRSSQTVGVASAIIGKVETQAVGDADIPEEVKQSVANLIRAQYGSDATWDYGAREYADTESSALRVNKIVLEVCDENSPDSDACANLNTYTNGQEARSSVIFLDDSWRVHFNAPSSVALKLLVDDFAGRIAGTNAQPFQFIRLEGRSGYLKAAAQANVYVLAAANTNTGWQDITATGGFLGDATGVNPERIKRMASKITGFATERIALLHLERTRTFTTIPANVIMVALTGSAERINEERAYCRITTTRGSEFDICDAFNDRWNVYEERLLDVPDKGISWRGSPAGRYFYVYAKSVQDAYSLIDAVTQD
ncbi:hypothetical protein HY546_01605 [archaeon]|nr:hypothetical protein [archaeon]